MRTFVRQVLTNGFVAVFKRRKHSSEHALIETRKSLTGRKFATA